MAVIGKLETILKRLESGSPIDCTACGRRSYGLNYCERCGEQDLCLSCWRSYHEDHDGPQEDEVDEWGMNLNQRSWLAKRGGR